MSANKKQEAFMVMNETYGGIKLLLTPQEAAQAISVKLDTVYAWVASGKIPAECIRRPGGRALRFEVEAFKKWAVAREVA